MTAASRTESIRSFLNHVAPRMSPERYKDVDRYLREEEWQLAVELLADSLDERDSRLDASEWSTFSDIATSVRLTPTDFSWLQAASI